VTGTVSVPGSYTETQYEPAVTALVSCAANAGATVDDVVVLPHTVFPVASVVVGPSPIPS
jgi:hypothetical protein